MKQGTLITEQDEHDVLICIDEIAPVRGWFRLLQRDPRFLFPSSFGPTPRLRFDNTEKEILVLTIQPNGCIFEEQWI